MSSRGLFFLFRASSFSLGAASDWAEEEGFGAGEVAGARVEGAGVGAGAGVGVEVLVVAGCCSRGLKRLKTVG